MKKFTAITLGAMMAAMSLGVLAGCGGLQAKGPQYEYTVIESDKDYSFDKEIPVIDGNVKIDGKFDESFYGESRNWFKGHKVFNNEEGTLDVTTYFSKSGIVVAAKFRDSRPVVYSENVATGNSSCVNCYFSVDSKSNPNYGVYEVECSAGNVLSINLMTSYGIKVIEREPGDAYSAVVRYGSISKGECFGYDVEYFMAWSLFGLEARPELVYLNPTMISARLNEENILESGADRTWYNFGYNQSPQISIWGSYNQGYSFDRDGFISNKITIQATGGKVTEEWGYDWCLTGDTVNFNVTPDAGKELASITVNGRDVTGEVKKNILSVHCNGDIEINATFAEKQAQ
ncbi:MAG: hypothetical protein SPH68_02395 [Candidatus Borkfalkiaceae bacterium]|nr:hypothetical protein [Clostridia bacterium]MDY6222996.1 hypothetical protein [Christensenellaceae bacterium]